MKTFCALLLPTAFLLACGVALGEDWPTALHDNQRSGVTSEELRPPLALRWQTPRAVAPAAGWSLPVDAYGVRKNKPDVCFDDAYRVIAAGDAAYYSSSGENCVYAIDAATGKVHWRYFTDAAPRLAPAFWNGKLYFGADDGVFRCIEAATGKQIWQFNARLNEQQMLGYGRFLSLWPIRAGGIVENGIAYLAAGLFPANHIFLCAVNAEDGRLVWRRQIDDGLGSDHVPQGYILAASAGEAPAAPPAGAPGALARGVLFTTSRTAPARWNAADGARIDFKTPFPAVKEAHEYRYYCGGSDAQIWNGRNIVFGSACILAYDPDKTLKDKYGRGQNGDLIFNWFGARQAAVAPASVPAGKDAHPMAFIAADDYVACVDQARLPELAAGECKEFEEAYKKLGVAGRLDAMAEYEQAVKEHGADYFLAKKLANGALRYSKDNWPRVSSAIIEKIKQKSAWLVPVQATEAMILTGAILYLGGEDSVCALDSRTGEKLWTEKTGSRVRGLAAASGRLFVSTVDGNVRCYDGSRGTPAAEKIPDKSVGATDKDDLWAAAARSIMAEAKTTRGYCLLVGKDADKLACELAPISQFSIYCLCTEDVSAARQRVADAGLYGTRIVINQSELKSLPFPPYVFNVAFDCAAVSGGAPSPYLAEVTKPFGGIAVIPSKGQKEITQNGRYDVRDQGPWRITAPRAPMFGTTKNWTHNYATPANTYCNNDNSVRGPFGVSWFGEPGPRTRIERHATPPMPLVVNGTMFTIGYDRVMAYDVYNGVCYWEREIEGATREGLPLNTSNIVADENSLFVVTSNKQCLRLDARTGKTLKTYEPVAPASVPAGKEVAPASAPAGKEVAPASTPAGRDAGTTPPSWAWIARDGALLFGSRAEIDERRKNVQKQTSNAVFALDVETGKPVWTREGRGIDHDGIAVAPVAPASVPAGELRRMLFFVDRGLTDDERKQAMDSTIRDTSVPDRSDEKAKLVTADLRKIVALDAASGKVLWEKPLNCSDITLDDNVICEGRVGVSCMVSDGVLVVHGTGSLGHPHKQFLAGEFARRAMYAFDAASGKLLWGGRKNYCKRPIIVGSLIYGEPFAWELKTGALAKTNNPLSGREQVLDFHRGYIGCGHLLASGSAIFGERRGISYWNLDDKSGFVPFGGMALACGLCAVPAGGVFAAPEGRSGCACDTPIHTSIVLYPLSAGTEAGATGVSAWGTGFTGGMAETFSTPVKHVCINLGAPGFRQSSVGKQECLWIPYPTRVDGGPLGKWLPAYAHDQQMCYYDETLAIENTPDPWIFTSGYQSDKPLKFRMLDAGAAARYTVKLYFAEPLDVKAGERVFGVRIQGKEVLTNFDIVAEAGAPRRALIKEFRGIEVNEFLEITLVPSGKGPIKQPLLCGFEASQE
ncbi:MAG TPA: PQQ-binding-like beta-propeller repeat protein [Planctomycetota bacterium]|jgi:outer membrane protein assembly factor BamB